MPPRSNSLLDQGYPDLEVIVIDGGSTDGSADILQSVATRLAYAVSEPDSGQAHAINKGFTRSTGSILAWLNSDDVLLPGALAAVGELFAGFPQVQWLTGQPANIGADGALRHFPLKSGYFRGAIRRGWYHGRALGFIRQEGTFWRRSLWDQSGGALDEARYYTMDYDLWRRFAQHAPLVTVAQTLAAFREHAAQKTAALDGYYAEAGVHVPQAARIVTVPARALISPLAWVVTAHVVRRDGGWSLYGLPSHA